MKNFAKNSILVLGIIAGLASYRAYSQETQVRVAFIGNSITYGAGLPSPANQNYPAQAGNLLAEVFGDTCLVKSFAVSGRTMLKKGDFPLWEEPEFDQALNFKPNIVVILLGTNDSKPYNWDDYGSEFFGDYMAMIDTFKTINPFIEFFVCYPPPAFEVVWDIRDSVIVHGVMPQLDSVMSETGAALIDFYAPLSDSVHLFPDFIHPDLEGSAAMARIVFDRFIETDVVHQANKGVAIISQMQGDRQFITESDSVGTLSWTTINAKAVYLDGALVDPSGSVEVNHFEGTSHTLIAEGESLSDTMVYEFIIYSPEVSTISLSASEVRIFTNDTATVTASYTDQYKYPMKDTVVDIVWSVSQGEGSVFGSLENAIHFSSTVAGSCRIAASTPGATKGIWISVHEREATSNKNPSGLPGPEVFPNPFNETITFRLEDILQEKGYLEVTDLRGRIHLHKKIHTGTSGPVQVETSTLPAGIYFYKLRTGNRVTTGKLLKQLSPGP